MTSLIVDFPRHHNGQLPNKMKEVRFSPTSSMYTYESCNVKTRGELFYSAQDYQSMKISNQRAVLRMREKYLPLSPTPRHSVQIMMDNSEEDVGDTLIGNEKIFMPGLARKIILSKRECLRAVLEEQARQESSRCLGDRCDPEELARASRQHSEANAQRAHAIGLVQASEGSLREEKCSSMDMSSHR